MCRLAVGYHHICPARVHGAKQGGCHRKFFLALEIMSEWKWTEQVMKKGGDPGKEAVREYLKAKAINKGKDWSRYSGRSLEDLHDRFACDSDKHSIDRWDQWAPTQQDVDGIVFRRYCSDCELKVHPDSRDRVPDSQDLPEDLDYTQVPPFKIGNMPFDDPGLKYEPTDEDEWLAPKAQGREEETESETTYAGESTSGVSSALSGCRESTSVASGETRSSVSATTGGTRSSVSAASGGSGSFVSSIAQLPRGGAPTSPPSGITNPYQLNLPVRRRGKSSLLSETSRGESLASLAEEDEYSEYDDGQTESSAGQSTSTVTERPRRPHSPTTDVHSGRRR